MIDFKVAPTSQNGTQYIDMVIGPGGGFETTQSIAQKVLITFATWLGDWFFDLTFGIDYPNLKGNSTIQEVDLKIQAKLLSIDGVVAITSFKSTFEGPNRVYAFTVQYITTDSQQNTLSSGG